MDDRRGDDEDQQLIEEVFDKADIDENLDYDLGDDDQEDEIREYERYIADPPEDLVIRNRENDDVGRLGIQAELDQEWTRRRGRDERRDEDDRPAELAAMEIVDDIGE